MGEFERSTTSCSCLIQGTRYYKPHSQAYIAGIKALGCNPEDILFVAGSSGDVVGAAEAGMRVVWNNHVGLEPKVGSNPLKEGKNLYEALSEFI